MRVPVQVLAASLLVELHANAPGKITEDFSSTLVPSTLMGSVNEGPSFGLAHPSVVAICE